MEERREPGETEHMEQSDQAANAGETADRDHAGATPPAGWIDVLAGVLFTPRRTFERLVPRPPLGLGVLVVLVALVVGNLVQSRGAAESLSSDLGIDLAGPQSLMMPMLLFTLVVGLLAWFGMVGVIHLAAGVLGGVGGGRAMAALSGLAHLPLALLAPVNLLANAGVPGMGLATLGIGIWSLYLYYRVIRAVHGLSRGRALSALLTPLGMFLVFFVAMLILFGSVFMEALDQFGDLPLP